MVAIKDQIFKSKKKVGQINLPYPIITLKYYYVVRDISPTLVLFAEDIGLKIIWLDKP